MKGFVCTIAAVTYEGFGVDVQMLEMEPWWRLGRCYICWGKLQ